MKDFKDKVLVVTGAADGIGRALALEGAQKGMKVVINDIDANGLNETESQVKAFGAECASLAGDISLLAVVQSLYKLAMDSFGKIHMLVNNAGVAVSGPIWELPLQDIDWITDVNLRSHAYGLRVFLPTMIAQGEPCAVINVASGAGLMTSPSAPMYHTTKFADVALAESTYLGLKASGHNHVQMHVLCPAFVKTHIHESDKHRPERYADMSDSYYQSQTYHSGLIRSAHSVHTGIDIDSVGMTVFTSVEENNFFILTHPEIKIPAGQRVKRLLDGDNPA
ncbi:MAG: hypothetical protein PWP24_435 [Clostridiales bacterium]|nr:hypothetical protein [Clostridiales bacterium]